MPHILPEYGAFLNLDMEKIARAPIVDERLKLKFAQDSLDRVYFNYQCDSFEIKNALVYQILLKIFTNMDGCVYMKQRKGTKDGQAVYFIIFWP